MPSKHSEPALWLRLKNFIDWGERIEHKTTGGWPDCMVSIGTSDVGFIELKAPDFNQPLGIREDQIAWMRRAIAGQRKCGIIARYPDYDIAINVTRFMTLTDLSPLAATRMLLLKRYWHDYIVDEQPTIMDVTTDPALRLWLKSLLPA